MKLLQVISLVLVVIGGLHGLLGGLGINLIGMVLGGPMPIISMIIGGLTVYHVLPVLKTHLSSL